MTVMDLAGYGPDAGCGECVAIGGELVCVGALAGGCAGRWRGDLSAAGAEDDGGDSVCDLDGGVCGSGGAAAAACLCVADRWRTAWARSAVVQVDVRWSFAIAALWLMVSLVRGVKLAMSAVRLRGIWKRAVPVEGLRLRCCRRLAFAGSSFALRRMWTGRV